MAGVNGSGGALNSHMGHDMMTINKHKASGVYIRGNLRHFNDLHTKVVVHGPNMTLYLVDYVCVPLIYEI